MTYEEALAIAEQRALNGTRAYALARCAENRSARIDGKTFYDFLPLTEPTNE